MISKATALRAITAVSCLTLSACATLFTGTRDTISFDSTPRGALVVIDGVDMGRTPVTLRVKRTLGSRVVTLRMAGYDDRTIVLGREFNVVSVLNLHNFFGWGIDAATGALLKYSQHSYHLELEPRLALAASLAVDDVLLLAELPRDSIGGFVVPAVRGSIAIVDPTTWSVVVAR
jgi:hypothetical protein